MPSGLAPGAYSGRGRARRSPLYGQLHETVRPPDESATAEPGPVGSGSVVFLWPVSPGRLFAAEGHFVFRGNDIVAYFLYFRKRPSVRVSCLRRTFINQPYYRMKRYLNLLFLAAAALCASCARDAVVSDVPPKGEDVGGYDNNVIVPGWVRIRLDDEAAPLRTGVFHPGRGRFGQSATRRTCGRPRGDRDTGSVPDRPPVRRTSPEIRAPSLVRYQARRRGARIPCGAGVCCTARRAACTADLSDSRTGRCRLSAAFGGERTFLLGAAVPARCLSMTPV